MPTNPKLDEMLIKAVQTSMRIEGYQPTRTEQPGRSGKKALPDRYFRIQTMKSKIPFIHNVSTS
jgi:hypothetical protein